MKTILQAIKAIDEEAEGSTIAKALGGSATISEAISEYEGGGGEGGDEDETTYYTLNFDLSGCEYTDGDNHIWDILPAEAYPAGTVVDLSTNPTRGYTFAPTSSSYEFDGWMIGGVTVTSVTMNSNVILQAALALRQGA